MQGTEMVPEIACVSDSSYDLGAQSSEFSESQKEPEWAKTLNSLQLIWVGLHLGVLLDGRRLVNPSQEMKEEFMEEGTFEVGLESEWTLDWASDRAHRP